MRAYGLVLNNIHVLANFKNIFIIKCLAAELGLTILYIATVAGIRYQIPGSIREETDIMEESF